MFNFNNLKFYDLDSLKFHSNKNALFLIYEELYMSYVMYEFKQYKVNQYTQF